MAEKSLRTAYLFLGTFIGCAAGYLFAKYVMVVLGVGLHLYSPRDYSLSHIVAVVRDTRPWLCPLAAIGFGSYAAWVCYPFALSRR